jgi:hypothetical protein
MATANPTITGEWVLIVTAGLEFCLSLNSTEAIWVAISDTETAPSVTGRLLNPSDRREPMPGITRAITGPGYLYAKTVSGNTVTAALDAWS